MKKGSGLIDRFATRCYLAAMPRTKRPSRRLGCPRKKLAMGVAVALVAAD